MSGELAWIEVHTFTERNGPELNGYREGGVPDGIYVPVDRLQGAVDLLDKLDVYVGHVNCGVVHGAPECTCGFDELYTRVRAVVRGQ